MTNHTLSGGVRALIQEYMDAREKGMSIDEVKREARQEVVNWNVRRVIDLLTDDNEPLQYENTADFYNSITLVIDWLEEIRRPSCITAIDEMVDECIEAEKEEEVGK